jgi:hypothetical protein
VGGDIPVDSEALLVIDFVNLKIKPAQYLRGTHRGRVCVRVFIGVSARTCMSIYVYTVFLKKNPKPYQSQSFLSSFVLISLFNSIHPLRLLHHRVLIPPLDPSLVSHPLLLPNSLGLLCLHLLTFPSGSLVGVTSPPH